MAHITRPCPKCGVPIDIPQPPPEQMKCPNCDVVLKFKAAAKPSVAPPAAAAPAPSRPAAAHAAAGQSKPAISTPLAGLEVRRELARGGLGVVYLAHDAHLKALRAIKRPLPGDGKVDPSVVFARFSQEMQAIADLSSPHVIRVYTAGEDAEGPYLVMEYLDGESLNALVARHGQLPVPEACELVRQAALGLQAAHECGLVHRDVKPSNLMLARAKASGARVVVIDWGLVRRIEGGQAPARRLTRLGETMGTPDYVAPEQVRDAQSSDVRADVYSLGATLYFLLAGRPPFAGRTDDQKLVSQAREEFPLLEQVRPDVGGKLLGVLKKMVRKERADRFSTPGEVAAALQHFCCAEPHRLLALFAPLPVQKTNPGITGGSLGGVTLPPSSPVQAAPVHPGPPSSDPTIVTPRPTELLTGQSVQKGRKRLGLILAGGGTILGVLILVVLLLSPKGGTSPSTGDVVGKDAATSGKGPALSLVPPPPEGPVLGDQPPGLLGKMPGHSERAEATWVAFMPEGRRAVSRNFVSIHVWDLEDRIHRLTLPAANSSLGVLAVSPDGSRFAASALSTLEFLDGKTYKKEGSPLGFDDWCTAAAFSPDGKVLLTAELAPGQKGIVRFWDPEKRRPLRDKIDFEAPVISLSFSLDGRFFVTTNGAFNLFRVGDVENKRIRVWRSADGRKVHELDGHPKAVCVAAFFADGKRLFSASPFDGTLRVWCVDEEDRKNVGKELRDALKVAKAPPPGKVPNPHDPDEMTCAAFWPWGRALVGYYDGGVSLWDLETGLEVWQAPKPSNDAHARVVALAISPDGHHALSALNDGNVYLYRLPPPRKNP